MALIEKNKSVLNIIERSVNTDGISTIKDAANLARQSFAIIDNVNEFIGNNSGILSLGAAMDSSLRVIKDNNGTSSPLYISTAEAAMQYTGKTANTAFNGFSLLNNTPATSSNQQYSPSFILGAMGWKTNATAASQAVAFRQLVVPVQGTANPTGYWSLGASINGGAYNSILSALSNGFVGIGISNPEAILDLTSTSSAFLPPRMTTSQFDNINRLQGSMAFSLTQNKPVFIGQSNVSLNHIVSSAIFIQTGDQTVASTVTETSIIDNGIGSLTLPPDFFVVGKSIRIRLRGLVSDTGTPDLTIRFKLGSTVIISGSGSLGLNITNKYFEVEAFISCRTVGETGTISAAGAFNYGSVGSPPSSETIGITQLSPTTINTTISHNLDATVEWGTASASNTITSQVGIVEILF